MSFRTFVLTFSAAFFILPTASHAQGTETMLQLLPNSERYLGGRTQENNEFSEPLRGPAESEISQNLRPDPAAPKIRPRAQNAYLPGNDIDGARPSALEDMYASRIVDELPQFGYDLFFSPTTETFGFFEDADGTPVAVAKNTPPSGAVQDDFILSVGDEVEIVFSGQRTDRGVYKINSQGMIVIEDFPPVPASGRTIAQVRLSIENAAQNLHNTQAYVALASVDQIDVLIVGHVKKPGRQTLNAFHTVLDALMKAQGVEETGSLRQIKLVRDGRSTVIDIYGLLMHGSTTMDLNLRDGDRIVVPPIGPTIAVAGEVKRPGIYEILPALNGMQHISGARSEKLSLNEMLDLAGGVLAPGKNRFLRLSLTEDGQEQVSETEEPFEPLFGDGSILMVSKGEARRSGTVELAGHTRRPGIHALEKDMALSDLISSIDVLGDDIYPLIGVVERWDDAQLTRKITGFPLRLVISGDYDQSLKDGDVVRLFSNEQIASLRHGNINESADAEEKSQGSLPPDEEDLLETHIDDTALASFLRERSAFVRGAVRNPGPYPVDEGISLDSLIAVAGGLSLEANTGNIEITSDTAGTGTHRQHVNFAEMNPREVIIGPGDSVRINQKFKKIEDKSVLIMGEVANPGRYDLLPGDRLSDLIERAGNFTAQSYPEGSIFSRESERKAEEARFRAQAREIKRAVASALEMKDEDVSAAKIAEARALAEELEDVQGVGRITVEADLAKLKAQPELDILLESGDKIFVPKRSLSVRVRGEVLSPATLQFREGKNPLDYVFEAGGFSFHADKERTFVLYPDGSAQPLQVSTWNHRAAFIPPGSTIVVPRDPEPFDFIQSAKDVSQILSNLAITAIFIDDVQSDD